MDDHDGMCRIMKEYYENIFSDPVQVDIRNAENFSRVTRDQNNRLVEEVTFEEFSMVVKQMHPDKASGPDGINPEFFQ